jgi:hypothetical protein
MDGGLASYKTASSDFSPQLGVKHFNRDALAEYVGVLRDLSVP